MGEGRLERLWPLIEVLADSAWHAGPELGDTLHISRAVLWKRIQQLSAFGLVVQAERGRGYRLAQPLHFLDSKVICAHLAAPPASLIVERALQSTNSALLEQAGVAPAQPEFLLADWQAAGRGRRGRSWVSPLGANVYMSFRWRFEGPLTELAGFSLALGVELAQGLEGMGLAGVGVKWPNDLQIDGRKLAGVLVELRGEAGGPANVVAGVGINTALPDALLRPIEQPVTDMQRELGEPVDRNRVAAMAIGAAQAVCERFPREGFSTWLNGWERHDALFGRPVVITGGATPLNGIACGVTGQGLLQVETAEGRTSIAAGEVSVRHVAA